MQPPKIPTQSLQKVFIFKQTNDKGSRMRRDTSANIMTQRPGPDPLQSLHT